MVKVSADVVQHLIYGNAPMRLLIVDLNLMTRERNAYSLTSEQFVLKVPFMPSLADEAIKV